MSQKNLKKMKSVNIAIIGSGVVGSAFISQLNALKTSIEFRVVYLARSSKEALFSKDYQAIDLLSYKTASCQPILGLDDLNRFLANSGKPTILVDNTSNETIAHFYPKFLASGISIATPNKKAFSSDINVWNEMFQPSDDNRGLVYHEATVGAGLPIIEPLNDLITTGDKIEKIEGIFSGTLSYIFNEFSTSDVANKAKFSDIVKIAKLLGYTEPDPRDDLNGLDVARKVTILARISGLHVQSPTAFPVESLIPKPLESIKSAEEFMAQLPEYDRQIQALKDEAFTENKVLRFVGLVDLISKEVSVGIGKYSFDHPFAALKGSDNVISIRSKRYPNPLVIQGAGAGAEVTAHGVLADTIKIAQRIAV